jgi:hypothetical protein
MPPTVQQNGVSPARSRKSGMDPSVILVTLVIGIVAIFLVGPQLRQSENSNVLVTLKDLEQRRLPMVLNAPDPLYREGTGLAVYCRQLDRALPPDARVFFSGMIGKDHGSRGGYYFFLRNYLFPRDVEISLDGKAVYREGWFDGIDATSPLEAQTNGFDVWLKIGDDNNLPQPVILSPKGAPKQ